MSRFILITDQDWRLQDKESTAYLDGKYWDQPTQLKNMHLTDAELLKLAEAGNIRGGARRAIPNGKLVI